MTERRRTEVIENPKINRARADAIMVEQFGLWAQEELLPWLLGGKKITMRAVRNEEPVWDGPRPSTRHGLDWECEEVHTMHVTVAEPIYPVERIMMTWKDEARRQRNKLRQPARQVRRMFAKAERAMFGREF